MWPGASEDNSSRGGSGGVGAGILIEMRRRFLLSVLASDLLALVLAMVVASYLTYGELAPWQTTRPSENIWPMLGMLAGGALIGSYTSLRMWAQGTPRPSYGRALAIVAMSVAVTAIGIVLFRPYWSRPYLATVTGVWLLGAVVHRYLRRLRP